MFSVQDDDMYTIDKIVIFPLPVRRSKKSIEVFTIPNPLSPLPYLPEYY